MGRSACILAAALAVVPLAACGDDSMQPGDEPMGGVGGSGGGGAGGGGATGPNTRPVIEPAGTGSLRSGRGAIATTSGGLVTKSESYRMVFTVGVGSRGSESSSSPQHRLRAGPIGAAEGTP
jgi:hypothetical protein